MRKFLRIILTIKFVAALTFLPYCNLNWKKVEMNSKISASQATFQEIEEFQAKIENQDDKKTEKQKQVNQEILDKKERIKQELTKILAKTPMESMAEIIAEQDQVVAAFIVGIALKESGLGKYSPYKDDRDCYNYWGYKGNINPTKSGYSCFTSPKEAVEVVGKRIKILVEKYQIKNPREMLIWKCGVSCKTHNSKDVDKWVSDVSIYFNKINAL